MSRFVFDQIEMPRTPEGHAHLMRKQEEWFLILFEDEEQGFNVYRSDSKGARSGPPLFFGDGEGGYTAAREQLVNDLKQRGYE